MLCEIAPSFGIVGLWATLTTLGLLSQIVFSGSVFVHSYVRPTYELWARKLNPEYPSVEMVRDEIIQMLKGLAAATIPPTLSIFLVDKGWTQGYCGTGGYSLQYTLFTWIVIVLGSDFIEWGYHQLGHRYSSMWEVHRHHHKFYNPTPFAVIADEWIDQLARASPLLVFPAVMPMNMDLLFFTYVLFFYGYGTYLHWGHELNIGCARDMKVLYGSYEHYLHHAISIKNKPLHTGFFLKLWDKLADTEDKGKCRCSHCERSAGKRTPEQFAKVVKPDYSPLLSPNFWLKGGKSV
mmetsp:Transcript_24795/g.74540  ORF Transcript_24795/g.74540 Transcript_24795/m.74540 type:complete len:293 (-) Transcript_24795:2894-3772(-)